MYLWYGVEYLTDVSNNLVDYNNDLMLFLDTGSLVNIKRILLMMIYSRFALWKIMTA